MTELRVHDDLVRRARATYAQALAAETKARLAARTARGELFAALRGRQAARIAVAGQLDEVPVPCSSCCREIPPWGDDRHTTVATMAELPYARCDLGDG